MSFSAFLRAFGSHFEYLISQRKIHIILTPWQTPEMERAHKNPLEKATCPLLPKNANLFIFKPIFTYLT